MRKTYKRSRGKNNRRVKKTKHKKGAGLFSKSKPIEPLTAVPVLTHIHKYNKKYKEKKEEEVQKRIEEQKASSKSNKEHTDRMKISLDAAIKENQNKNELNDKKENESKKNETILTKYRSVRNKASPIIKSPIKSSKKSSLAKLGFGGTKKQKSRKTQKN